MANDESVLPELSFPMILKPNSQGSGMGVTLVENISEYRDTLKKLLNEYGTPILCEEYIQGIDVTVPMLEKDNQIYDLAVLSILDANGTNLKLYDAEIKLQEIA